MGGRCESLDEGVPVSMSKRRDMETHIRSLGEISDIMSAMKNLAMMETQKLTKLLSAQERLVSSMLAAGMDFLTFYPEALPTAEPGRPLYLVIGSERGFCGDYNEKVCASVHEQLQVVGDKDPVLITIGRKLAAWVSDNRYVAERLEGASVAEEVPSVMTRVMDHVHRLQREDGSNRRVTITVVSHDVETGGVHTQTLRAFELFSGRTAGFTDPPALNLAPPVFLAELLELYFFSLLYKIFYSALVAENRARMSHLEGAIQRLDRETTELELKRNTLRQEEITEEIELLMLSAKRLWRR